VSSFFRIGISKQRESSQKHSSNLCFCEPSLNGWMSNSDSNFNAIATGSARKRYASTVYLQETPEECASKKPVSCLDEEIFNIMANCASHREYVLIPESSTHFRNWMRKRYLCWRRRNSNLLHGDQVHALDSHQSLQRLLSQARNKSTPYTDHPIHGRRLAAISIIRRAILAILQLPSSPVQTKLETLGAHQLHHLRLKIDQ
jgi:hypothetical protein